MTEVSESYVDVWGEARAIAPETRDILLEALGPGTPASARKPPKGRCYLPPALQNGARVWGYTVQLYGLRSAHDWGIGDFGDLRRLVELAAGLGAALVGVNPLHAASVSPYSPSSRHALNVLYLDLPALPGFGASAAVRSLIRSRAFRRRLAALREAPLVDYEGVRALKLQVMERLFAGHRGHRGLAAFRRRATRGVRAYALFEALREKLGDGWQNWPAPYRDPRSRAVAEFARRNARRVDFHLYFQWQARLQLEGVQRRAHELGMAIGLYVDLALGADAGGAEVWADQASFATSVSCGAPPDEFNPKGQDWGLPPYSPRALARARFRPFAELLAANMPEGGALRMDHVLSLCKLWWVPRGFPPEKGGYVNSPFEALIATLARESRKRRCMVIGEDLGTVPAALRRALNDAGVLSYRPLLFEKREDGRYAAPHEYPRDALTCVTTHDLPTFAGFFANRDLELREQLGLAVDPAKEAAARERDKNGLLAALEREGLDGSAASAHRFLARTPCRILAIQPEDVLELREQANLPGTVAEQPNWRRRLPLPLEAWARDPRMISLARMLAPLRGTGKRIPGATYRLQFNRAFRFTDAIALVPYLAALGVSHVYASPFLKARPGSDHGYDVIDHGQVNPEIGTFAQLERLIDTLRRHGMGLVLDIVPNHMAVLGTDNRWWTSVLAEGPRSPYAAFFDIDWNPARGDLRGKVLLPVLGSHYGDALQKGEIALVREKGVTRVRYHGHRFPLARGAACPRSTRGDAASLHRLLERQHYRLAYWRVASDEINYRRFFEIADLAALRVEEARVFDATHALIVKLCERPGVDGLRIDHPDGLADPGTYLDRLAERCGRRGGRPWVIVEKILADHETLPEDWQAHGTTGYRFANLLTGLFVDRGAARRFDRIYRRFTGEHRSFDDIAYESRMLIMSTTLAAELATAAHRLAAIAAEDPCTRDYTESGLAKALAEVAASFPVYRSYVTARGASAADRRYIGWAIAKARRASRIADPGVFDFIRGVLTLELAPPRGHRRAAMVDFARRFQQLTAPVVAKGVEDTAFYRYHRLAALNEVGNHPENFGFSLKAFHAASADRAARWPHTMIGSTTHDTKRSEDVRARLAVLSEVSAGWRLTLRRMSLINRKRRTETGGDAAPSALDEYLYYQSAIGIWPLTTPDARALAGLQARLQAYMLKAAREAKLRTSWINPDAEYESRLERFIAESLASPLFVKEIDGVIARIGHLALLVGLSQATLKVAAPGVPDYYQGTELYDFSLVDPDNRRPVDYALRRRLLDQAGDATPEELLGNLADGRAKLRVISRGLHLRRTHPELFLEPAYTPLGADAGREENVCAFMMGHGRQAIVAVAPRLFSGLMGPGESAPIGRAAWGDASLPIPAGTYENVLTAETLEVAGSRARIADVLARFPVALLVRRHR